LYRTQVICNAIPAHFENCFIHFIWSYCFSIDGLNIVTFYEVI